MTKRKLPPASNWQARDIDDWNVTTFTEYLRDKHRELFGIDYAPFGGTWGMEQGVLGDLIGTQSRKSPKPRTASNASVKRFIDETFDNYRPTSKYPGTSFGFMWTYRKTDWQRIQAEELADKRREERQQALADVDYSDVEAWL